MHSYYPNDQTETVATCKVSYLFQMIIKNYLAISYKKHYNKNGKKLLAQLFLNNHKRLHPTIDSERSSWPFTKQTVSDGSQAIEHFE